MKEFRGSFTVMVTPMKQDQSIDEGGIKKNIDWYIEEGTAGICVLGSTGEFLSLSKKERHKAAEIAVEHINGRVPCLIGTAEETTAETIEYTKHAKKIGADGALIINSYYCKPSENEIYEHFKAISEAVDIPIMLYNNPWTSGVDIKPELVAKICHLKNICYVKESSMEIRRIRDIAPLIEGEAQLFCGCDDLAFESFVLGAVGWISVCSNIIPGMSQQLFELVQKNEIQKAKELYIKMLPLLHLIENSGKLVQVVKAAMNKMGRAAGPCRLPRLPLTPDEDAALEKVLADMGLIDMR